MRTFLFHNLPKDLEDLIFEYSICEQVYSQHMEHCESHTKPYWAQHSFWKGQYSQLRAIAKLYNTKCKGIQYIIDNLPEDAKMMLREDHPNLGLDRIKLDFRALLETFDNTKRRFRAIGTSLSREYLKKCAYPILDYVFHHLNHHNAFKRNPHFKNCFYAKLNELRNDGLNVSHYYCY